jgi:hypothetical protein
LSPLVGSIESAYLGRTTGKLLNRQPSRIVSLYGGLLITNYGMGMRAISIFRHIPDPR